MSCSSVRILSLLIVLVVLPSCDFRPLFKEQASGGASGELATVEIKPIADGIGQLLRNRLLDLINPKGAPANPSYVLRITLKENIERLAVKKSAFATRANLNLTAEFNLYKAAGKDGKKVLSGRSAVISSYNILNSDFATLMAEKDARARAAHEIGDDIHTRLSVFFVQHGKAGANPEK